MKKLTCSKCGIDIKVTHKAYPKHRTILYLVTPHKCDKNSSLEDKLKSLPLYNDIIGDKNNKEKPTLFNNSIEDKRPDKRTSIAPESLIESIKKGNL